MNTTRSRKLLGQAHKLLQRNDVGAARQRLESLLQQDPGNRDAHLLLGQLLFQQGGAAAALPHLERAVKPGNGDAMAYNLLGQAYQATHRLDAAIASYQRVTELAPKHPFGFANLATAWLERGGRAEAIQYCRQALAIDPRLVGVHTLLASALYQSGEFEAALASYQRALELEPGNMNALIGRAQLLVRLGQFESAGEYIDALVARGVRDHVLASAFAQLATHTGREQDALVYAESLLAQGGYHPEVEYQLHFTLGGLYDRSGDHDAAFRHYAAGNAKVKRRYDRDKEERKYSAIIEGYSKPALATMPRATAKGVTPVFVIGFPRSGTSLVERILGMHPDVHPAGELPHIPALAAQPGKNGIGFPRNVITADAEQLNVLAGHLLEHLEQLAAGARCVVDKMPHNFLFLGMILQLFPQARIVHCRRAPLDTCLSNYFQSFSGTLSYAYDLDNIAHQYRLYRTLMAHWRGCGVAMHEIDYEALVSDQEGETRRLLEYLDLDWDAACLRFHESDQVTRTASNLQVRNPIYTRSVDRWRHYQAHIEPLITALEAPLP